MARSLLATSDLHVSHEGNSEVVERLRPYTPEDWLIVAGDVGDTVTEITWTLDLLARRFAKVIWVPGNHELWTTSRDTVKARGEERYRILVDVCRELGVLTPEDPFPDWETEDETFTIAPLFTLFDYSFREPGLSFEAAMRDAHETGVVGTDDMLLHPDPHPTRQAWCAERIRYSESRLDAVAPDRRTILVSHWPLHRGPTTMLWYPRFAMWCGTTATGDWHLRYRAAVAVYGHLHIPLTFDFDGVRFEEVSLGYPREWRRRTPTPYPIRRILPADPSRTTSNHLLPGHR
ncbi:metallophosphoesterase [Actinoalloteichus sp. AHMU CJ021]|uniref:3',5'-cyclic AMP phosphodiesterase CpdA n=1 Tax=Actinoalloteichus caeruleus DSM 43889 TaxID=1120930 RepID=A0ABT1JG47_ACTCY|nr:MULTISPECIES: metallophosphoesterase [Actinoalloteichus]AUS77537.1 metallophosphoesterase [Actinoalloteichus sp. AHMU CJ021]MCP2331413.1 3',5'-cyclic AMP phosphodiesterase CpdA [Actinoalloteichus caeruleus DSM 43889]